MSIGYKPNWGRVTTSQGYLTVYCPDHPAAWKSGYVYIHRVVVEMQLGRLLSPDEVVHHKNGNKQDNRPENLEVLDAAAHSKGHHPEVFITLVCTECGVSFLRKPNQRAALKGYTNAFCGRRCNGIYSRRKQMHG